MDLSNTGKNEQVFALLESKVVAGRRRRADRSGLWQILVLGVVRLDWIVIMTGWRICQSSHAPAPDPGSVSCAAASEKPSTTKTLFGKYLPPG